MGIDVYAQGELNGLKNEGVIARHGSAILWERYPLSSFAWITYLMLILRSLITGFSLCLNFVFGFCGVYHITGKTSRRQQKLQWMYSAWDHQSSSLWHDGRKVSLPWTPTVCVKRVHLILGILFGDLVGSNLWGKVQCWASEGEK